MQSDDELVRILNLACDHLGMAAAFVSELTPTRQVYRAVAGAADGFGLVVDDSRPRAETYCDLMVPDHLALTVPDTSTDPRVQHLAVTSQAGIGAYVGVPVTLSDGRLYGTFCCLSHDADPDLDARDAKFMQLLASMVSARVETVEIARQEHREVRQTIDDGAVEIALQPIVSLASGRWRGAEALARFPASERRVDEMFAMASRAGLGAELELLCLRKALGRLEHLPPDVYLSVNMSPDGIATTEFARLMTGCPTLDNVVLEVTEHAPVEAYASLLDVLAPLRAAGMRLAVDDVGAGYASFRHVLQLHPDILKIDRSLVDRIASDSAMRSIAGNLVLLALDLRATVVAEGVENLADLEVLETIGVDMAQGYLFARPSVDPTTWSRWSAGLAGRPSVQPGAGRPPAPRAAGTSPAGDPFDGCGTSARLSEACEAVVEALVVAGYEMPSVYLLSDGVLRCQAARGYFQVVDGFGIGTGVIGRIAATGQGTLIRDVSEHPEFIAAVPGVVSEAGVPVWVEGRIAAVVNLESTRPLPPACLTDLTAAAAQLAEWMTRHGGAPASPLQVQVSRACLDISALDDPRAIEDRALAAAISVSGMSSAAVVHGPSGGTGPWAVTSAVGPLARTARGWTAAELSTMAGWVSPGTSSHLPRGQQPPAGHPFLADAGVQALAVLPLARSGEVTGLLLVLDRRRPVAAEAEVQALLELLAASTAAALNASRAGQRRRGVRASR